MGDLKKQKESKYLAAFVRGTPYSIEQSERPDGWLLCNGARLLGIELTEYNSAYSAKGGNPRRIMNDKWQNTIWPTLDAARRSVDGLRHMLVSIRRFGPTTNAEIDVVCTELLQLLSEDGLHDRIPSTPVLGCVTIEFACEEKWAVFNALDDSFYHASSARYPLLSKVCPQVSVFRSRTQWPRWDMPQTANFAPGVDSVTKSPGLFNQIVQSKNDKAATYEMNGLPLALVIVCDLLDDLSTRILADAGPQEICTIHQAFSKAAPSLTVSPFSSIWLLSAEAGTRLKLWDKGIQASLRELCR